VAYEWVHHAGKVLFDKSREDGELSPMDKRALAAGSLFVDGEPGLNTDRWGFWKQKLEELASDGQASDAAKEKARSAVDEMKALEG
jgi:Protein of unknown function (DUF3632)